MSYCEHNYHRSPPCPQCRDELEAEAAAMREALKRIENAANDGDDVECKMLADEALRATDAGKALLERLRKLDDAATGFCNQLTEAKAVLREVEWSVAQEVDGRPLRRCPSCRCIKPGDGYMDADPNRLTGHAPDCRLAKVLK